MSGTVIANTPIAVDYWQIRRNGSARLFFLTHFHSDHTQGLQSTWKHPIYCSEITGRLIHQLLKVNKDLIRPLELGVAHKINLDEHGVETMNVTLIDANHCPGSVMFLFEGYFGTILHTGDFRYRRAMLQEPPLNNSKKIDVLYLDNTNCNPQLELPSRERATEQIKGIIKKHPEHNVVIGLYNIGKEELLVELAKCFQTWIVVSPGKLGLLKLLEVKDVFTDEEGAGRIQVVNNSDVKYANMEHWNRIQPTIAILPTGQPRQSSLKNVHIVPYSDHSSFEELQEFVCTLKPSSLEPVIKDQPCEMYFTHCMNVLEKPLLKIKIPITVQAFMQCRIWQEHCRKTTAARGPIVRTTRHIARGVVFEPLEKCDQSTTTNLRDNQRSTYNSHVGGTISTATEDHVKSPSTSEDLPPQDLLVDSLCQKGDFFEDQQNKSTSRTSLQKSPSPAPINLECTDSSDEKRSMLHKQKNEKPEEGKEKERARKEDIEDLGDKKVEHIKEMVMVEKGSCPECLIGVKEKCTASSDSLSMTELPDYLIKYTTILSSEQRETYQNDFNSGNDEYQNLHTMVENDTKEFMKRDFQLKQLSPGSRPDVNVEKYRPEYLHNKFAHIKRLISEFDRQQAEALNKCTPRRLQGGNKHNLTCLEKKEDIKRPHQCNQGKKPTKKKRYSLVPPANRYIKKGCV